MSETAQHTNSGTCCTQATAAPARSGDGGAASGRGTYICPMCPGVESDRPDACPTCGMALESATPQPTRQTRYTCPMHPEIVQDEPGECPTCGMALEPMSVTIEPERSPELIDMTRRLWVGAALALPVLLLAMGPMLPGLGPVLEGLIPGRLSRWLELAFATPVVRWAGGPFFRRGWSSLKARSLNMFTLIALGVGAAYGFSAVATLAPGLFPPAFRGPDGQIGVYFEAAAMIVVLVLLGQVLELRGREKTAARAREDRQRPTRPAGPGAGDGAAGDSRRRRRGGAA